MRDDSASLIHTDILKFYGCELGAQTNYDKNTGMSIVNGAHDQGTLVGLLEVSSDGCFGARHWHLWSANIMMTAVITACS